MQDRIFDPVKAKAAAVLAAVGAVIGALFLISEPVGTCALVGAVAGYWVLERLIVKRHGETPDLLSGAAELTHRALLETRDLAHKLPEYREAALHLEMAEEAIRQASSAELARPRE